MELTTEQKDALDVARELIDAGIPVFAAPPCPDDCRTQGHARLEFHLPKAWQKIGPSVKQLERWRPGWGLAAIGGHAADFIDQDSHAGGDASVDGLKAAGLWPRVFAEAQTPSGGRHYLISPLRLREANKFLPGVDYQGGDEDGEGRAFVWIAPTVKRSKAEESAGEKRPYRWIDPPDVEKLAEYAEMGDDSVHGVRDAIVAHQEKAGSPVAERKESAEKATEDPFTRASEVGTGTKAARGREFTTDAAWAFVTPTLQALREAKIGSIEENANRAAVMLSHFVPDFLTADEAYAILADAASHTAYDPNHSASAWTLDKFRPVLDGSRVVRDDWKAVKLLDVPEGLRVSHEAPSGDEVDALLAEMLDDEAVSNRPVPEQLIKGLLTMDSEAWLIGAPGSKKSFVTLHMAGCIGTGRKFLGMPVRKGLVIMIVAEGAAGTSLRVKAWRQKYGSMENVKFLPRPVQVSDRKAWSVLVEACRRLEPVCVVVDTQARVTVGLEENSAKEMGIYVDAVGAIRSATGACVLTVHHTGRNGLDARGSSAIDGAQGTELKVVAKSPRQGVLKVEKQKDLEERAEIEIGFEQLQVGQDDEGDSITSLVVSEDAYVATAGEEQRPEEERAHIPEPAEWTRELTHANAGLQRRILMTMHYIGGSIGRTQAEYRKVITERWYSTPGAKLTNADWGRAWTAVAGKEFGQGEVLVRKEAGRFILHPDIADHPEVSAG